MFDVKRSTIRDTYSMAGWLFADLLLGLSMLFLISNTVGTPPVHTPTSTPTITPTMTLTPTLTTVYEPGSGGFGTPEPTLTPTLTTTPLGVIGLGTSQCYNLDLKPGDLSAQQDAILSRLKEILPNDDKIKAGMLIVWGNGGDSLTGRRIANQVGLIIKKNFAKSFDENTQEKDLFLDSGIRNRVIIEVYFFTNAEWKTGQEVNCNTRW